MNILYLCDEYPPGRHGGIGTAVQLLARAMAKRGHKVVVAGFYDWGYGGTDEFEDEGVKVYRFRRGLDSSFFSKKDSLLVRGTYKLFYLTGIFQRDISRSIKKYKTFLDKIIREHKIDIIEQPDFNEYVQYCKSPVYFPELSIPAVVKLHGSISYFMKEVGQQPPIAIFNVDKEVLHKADAVSSVSSYTAAKTAAYMDYHGPIEVVYNGIDTHITVAAVKEKALVIYTGSLVAKKGIYQLMKAWNIVHEQIPAAKLEVYGKGPVDRIKKCLRSSAVNSVSFKGHVQREQLFKRLAAASLAVFPSYAECFALGPMEAMAADTAVLYSTRTSGPELINDGFNGMLADPDNVNELANKMLYLLQNPGENERMAAEGQKRIQEHFDIDVIAEKNEAFYRSVLNR
jgi:glycosyltransferase involved in cell wall biosynthesis